MNHNNSSNDRPSYINIILTGILVFASFVLVFLCRWVFTTWSGLRMDELIFQLKAPIEGTGDGIVMKGVVSSILPALILTGLFFVFFSRSVKKQPDHEQGKLILFGGRILALLLIRSALICLETSGSEQYPEEPDGRVTLYRGELCDPADVEIRFPPKKRNLIYMYLESMEVTYTDTESGGAFSYNNIPELTELTAHGEDFSGDTGMLNGGRVLPGTTFTMGGIFAQTAALPLKVDIGEEFTDQRGSFNKMNTQDAFFKKVTNLGDLLEENGYQNVFMLGSNATFGGRRLYFGTHGNYEIDDYMWAIEQGIIPENYYVFWGMEDQKLFRRGKREAHAAGGFGSAL